MELEEEKKLRKPEESKAIKKVTLTPDTIMNMLFRMDSTAEYYHLQTTSYAQHKMLDELHESIEEHKDSICEYLLGIQAPKKFGPLTQNYNEVFSTGNLDKFLDEIFKFSVSLCSYAKEHNLEQLCNLGSELQGSAAKAKYLNTLK